MLSAQFLGTSERGQDETLTRLSWVKSSGAIARPATGLFQTLVLKVDS